MTIYKCNECKKWCLDPCILDIGEHVKEAPAPVNCPYEAGNEAKWEEQDEGL